MKFLYKIYIFDKRYGIILNMISEGVIFIEVSPRGVASVAILTACVA